MLSKLRFIAFIGLFAATVSQADLVIDVQGVAQPTPVAIVPFGWDGNTPAMPLDVSKVITDDLKRSGRFAPVSEDKMLQKPTDGADVDFQDWSFVGVEAVVVGNVTQTGEDAYTLQFQLFDVFGRRQLVGFRMPSVTRATMRGAARSGHDLREADRDQRCVRHQGRLRHCEATGRWPPVLVDRVRPGRLQRVHHYGE